MIGRQLLFLRWLSSQEIWSALGLAHVQPAELSSPAVNSPGARTVLTGEVSGSSAAFGLF